jgi:Ser/Thr protein kinase RdoA (MazF antagonist)
VKGAHETLAQEAAFHRACRSHPDLAPFLEAVPLLIDFDETQPVLMFDRIADAVGLASLLEAEGRRDVATEAAFALGSRLGTLHRRSRSIPGERDGPAAWLLREPPWVLSLQHPGIAWLAELTPANADTLRILRSDGTFAERFEQLSACWRTECVIHGDVRLDNILVQSDDSGSAGGLKVWIVDWEMVQVGDPAWDVAGALQDFLVNWVSTMPMEGGLSAEERAARARWPIASLRRVTRAVWSGYRRGAGLEPAEAGELLSRAVVFSAARLIQSAYEAAVGADRLPGQSVILLQLAANVLAEPERALVQLYGVIPSIPRL